MSTEIKTTEILQALKEKYSSPGFEPGHEWVFFEELRVGPGFGKESERRIDFWAMRCWSGATERVSYEIKVSRQDFLREMKDARKRKMALLFSTQYYFITPPGLIKPDELPPECGLREVRWTNNAKEIERAKERNYHQSHIPEYKEFLKIETIVEAPTRDSYPPSWRFLASICRRIMREGVTA